MGNGLNFVTFEDIQACFDDVCTHADALEKDVYNAFEIRRSVLALSVQIQELATLKRIAKSLEALASSYQS